MKPSILQSEFDQQSQKAVRQKTWQRVTLLIMLGYEAAGCLVGGAFLAAAPDGHLMEMPVHIMHGTFADFFIPGIILFGLGILNTIAFIAVLRRNRIDWIMASLALGGLTIWFIVEIAITQEIVWLHFMWGMPVYAGIIAMIPLIPSQYAGTQRALLLSGIISSVLYVLMNIFIPLFWSEYNSASQTVSELSAVGAPTRALWVWVGLIYTPLVIAFTWGVWRSAQKNRALRIAGGSLVAYGLLGILWPLAPMHLRETIVAGGATISDTFHIALGVVTEIFFLLAVGFAAAALGKRFRLYSIATVTVIFIFGVLTFIDAPGIAANQPTPLIGVWERINIGVFLLWISVLASILLRAENDRR